MVGFHHYKVHCYHNFTHVQDVSWGPELPMNLHTRVGNTNPIFANQRAQGQPVMVVALCCVCHPSTWGGSKGFCVQRILTILMLNNRNRKYKYKGVKSPNIKNKLMFTDSWVWQGLSTSFCRQGILAILPFDSSKEVRRDIPWQSRIFPPIQTSLTPEQTSALNILLNWPCVLGIFIIPRTFKSILLTWLASSVCNHFKRKTCAYVYCHNWSFNNGCNIHLVNICQLSLIQQLYSQCL